MSLEFVDFELCRDEKKYDIDQCRERDATYAAPLKVRVRLHNKETEEIKEHEIFMGDLPLMTATGTFIINGAERVIVSQLVRSPGIYYAISHDKVGKELYSATVIPNRGAWLEYETDSNDVFSVRVDRNRKVPITVFLRALGLGTNEQIKEVDKKIEEFSVQNNSPILTIPGISHFSGTSILAELGDLRNYRERYNGQLQRWSVRALQEITSGRAVVRR